MADSAVLNFLLILELLKHTNKILSVEIGNYVFPIRWIAQSQRKTNEQVQLLTTNYCPQSSQFWSIP
jgi:hypothetical protein